MSSSSKHSIKTFNPLRNGSEYKPTAAERFKSSYFHIPRISREVLIARLGSESCLRQCPDEGSPANFVNATSEVIFVDDKKVNCLQTVEDRTMKSRVGANQCKIESPTRLPGIAKHTKKEKSQLNSESAKSEMRSTQTSNILTTISPMLSFTPSSCGINKNTKCNIEEHGERPVKAVNPIEIITNFSNAFENSSVTFNPPEKSTSIFANVDPCTPIQLEYIREKMYGCGRKIIKPNQQEIQNLLDIQRSIKKQNFQRHQERMKRERQNNSDSKFMILDDLCRQQR